MAGSTIVPCSPHLGEQSFAEHGCAIEISQIDGDFTGAARDVHFAEELQAAVRREIACDLISNQYRIVQAGLADRVEAAGKSRWKKWRNDRGGGNEGQRFPALLCAKEHCRGLRVVSIFQVCADEPYFTCLRATLIFVAEHQNVTLSVPREILKRAKRLAAERDTSVSALMTEALARLTDEDRRYSAAKKRALGAMKSARSLGTQGRRTWTRDELHER